MSSGYLSVGGYLHLVLSKQILWFVWEDENVCKQLEAETNHYYAIVDRVLKFPLVIYFHL